MFLEFTSSKRSRSSQELPLLWGPQLLSVDSREIIKVKSPPAILQSPGGFAGLMLAPEGGIRTGPRSAGVNPHSLMPYSDYCPHGRSQPSTQHLIDINSPLHSGSSVLTHPNSYKHTYTLTQMLNSFKVMTALSSKTQCFLCPVSAVGNFPRIPTLNVYITLQLRV